MIQRPTMDTSTILEQLVSLNEDVANNKPAARENMLVAAQALVTSLQTPSEFISCVGWAEPARFACLKTALDLKLFETLTEHDEAGGATIAELAQASGAQEGLLARIMKHLVAMNLLVERPGDRFANTELSSQFTDTKYRDGLIYCHDVAGPSFSQMPSFFKKTEYKEPLNPVDGPFQFAHNTKNHFFPWLAENPAYFAAFANYMGGYRAGKQPWFAPTFYPVQEQLINGFSADSTNSPFLVDVGGGKGHDLLALQSQFPSLPGKLFLQDKPDVISSIDPPLPSTIDASGHDFFTPQPVAGARAYFLHSVLHDWDDESCINILRALKPAMKPGYSKVLVHDLIVLNKGATWGVTSMDWLMMALGSVRERTESDFRRLFEAAGLEVQKVWIYEQGTEGIVEAILPA